MEGVKLESSQAPWQALPVLIDRKIAADDGLPLTENQLTVSQTAIFVGVLEVVEYSFIQKKTCGTVGRVGMIDIEPLNRSCHVT